MVNAPRHRKRKVEVESPATPDASQIQGGQAPGAAAPTVSSQYQGASAVAVAQGGPAQMRVDPIAALAAQHMAFEGLFSMLAARSNALAKSPVCYQQLSDGSWLMCMLQDDGSYGQCKAYSGPVHGPVCG